MRKILVIMLAALVLLSGATVVSAVASENEIEYLTRAVANSYGDESFGVKVAVCAVAFNLKEAGLADSLAGAVALLASEGEFCAIGRQNGQIDDELYLICKDAAEAAAAGADPTGGAMSFRRLRRKTKADLHFDDSREDALEREMWRELERLAVESGCGVTPTIIDGVGFY